MKKILNYLLVIFLISLVGCSNQTFNEDKPNNEINENVTKEEIYSLIDLYNQIEGKWACGYQDNDYYLVFNKDSDGKVIIEMNDNENTILAEVASCTYNKETKLYTINLLELAVPLKYNQLHLSLVKIEENIIETENIYKDYQKDEFCYQEEMNGAPVLNDAKYVANIEGIGDYQPYIEFDAAGMFTYYENCYSGVFKITGGYKITEEGYECLVDDNSALDGYKGYDVKKYQFEKIDDETIMIKNDICMSYEGMLLYLVK